MRSRFLRSAVVGLATLSLLTIAGFAWLQSPSQISRGQLRALLAGLGHEVKDLESEAGKEKYQVTIERGGLDIPIGVEISASNNYVWMTVNLGEAPPEASLKNAALLRENFKLQPTQFYITGSNRLMAALPVDNREVNNTVLRQKLDQLAGNVVDSKSVWQTP